jgi:hypothetical protein
MLLLSFIYVIEVFVHVVIEFLLNLLSYLSHFFDYGILHATPPTALSPNSGDALLISVASAPNGNVFVLIDSSHDCITARKSRHSKTEAHPAFAYFDGSWGFYPQTPGICRFLPIA